VSSSSSIQQRNEAVLTAVRQRLEEDPKNVLPTLRLLIDPDATADPLDDSAVSLAKTLNAYRVVATLREFRERSYNTSEVAEMLGGISRQAVSLRVTKGQLMSIQISGKAWFPAWQFKDGRPVAGLGRVIEALTELGEDALSADALMRTALPEEDGRSPADLLAMGDVDGAMHYVWAVGGGF
jgi:hypothetical protein